MSSSISEWDRRFLQLCETVATWSKDPSTKVGSIIVDGDKRIHSVGFNGFPMGVEDYVSRLENREKKYLFISHAERNAMDLCKTDVTDCTLYCTLLPCNECAKSIIQKGIKRVVCYDPKENRPNLNWNITKMMFKEASVRLVLI